MAAYKTNYHTLEDVCAAAAVKSEKLYQFIAKNTPDPISGIVLLDYARYGIMSDVRGDTQGWHNARDMQFINRAIYNIGARHVLRNWDEMKGPIVDVANCLKRAVVDDRKSMDAPLIIDTSNWSARVHPESCSTCGDVHTKPRQIEKEP